MTAPMATFLAYLDNKHISDANRGTDGLLVANPNFQITLTNKSGPIPLEKDAEPGRPAVHELVRADLASAHATDAGLCRSDRV